MEKDMRWKERQTNIQIKKRRYSCRHKQMAHRQRWRTTDMPTARGIN